MAHIRILEPLGVMVHMIELLEYVAQILDVLVNQIGFIFWRDVEVISLDGVVSLPW